MDEEVKDGLETQETFEETSHEEEVTEEKEEETEEQESESEESGEESTDESKKKRNSAQKRINELTRARREAEREAQFWKDKALATSKEELPKEEVKEDELKKPVVDDFDTYDEYYEALADYKAELKVRKALEAREAREKQSREADKQVEVLSTFKERAKAASEKYEDFDDVITDPETPYNDVMRQVVFESEVGPDIAYYLGTHKDVAEKVAKMPPLKAAVEMGKIEKIVSDKLNPPKQKKVSQSPPPITPVKGSKSGVNKDPDKMTMEEYRQWRMGKK